MAAPVQTGQVIQVDVADDTIATGRILQIQSIYAKGAATVTNGAGNTVADMTAGSSIEFPCGLQLNGLNVAGTGPVYVYLK